MHFPTCFPLHELAVLRTPPGLFITRSPADPGNWQHTPGDARNKHPNYKNTTNHPSESNGNGPRQHIFKCSKIVLDSPNCFLYSCDVSLIPSEPRATVSLPLPLLAPDGDRYRLDPHASLRRYLSNCVSTAVCMRQSRRPSSLTLAKLFTAPRIFLQCRPVRCKVAENLSASSGVHWLRWHAIAASFFVTKTWECSSVGRATHF